MAFDFRDLTAPVSVAPMAGWTIDARTGRSRHDAGGLGFVAAGYLGADAFADRWVRRCGWASGTIGANLSCQPRYRQPGDRRAVRRAAGARCRSVTAPRSELRASTTMPGRASSTFCSTCGRRWRLSRSGCPPSRRSRGSRGAGITVAGTVTTVAEAREAADRGVDVLVAQGPAAGGHRVNLRLAGAPRRTVPRRSAGFDRRHARSPVVAAGGLMTAADIARDARAVRWPRSWAPRSCSLTKREAARYTGPRW